MSLSRSVSKDGPQSAAVVEKAGDPNDLFERLFDVAKRLKLPRNSWAVHCIDKDGVRDIVFSQVLVKHVPKVTALYLPKTKLTGKDEITTVYCPKTVAIKSDASVTVSLMGVPVQAIEGVPSEVASGADVERLLEAVDALRVCRGGPNKKVYPGAEPESAYLDSLDAWRHYRCPLVLTEPGELCRLCRSLDPTVRLNMERKLRKQRAGFESVRIPSSVMSQDVLLLRRQKYRLQRSNKRLEGRIHSTLQELDDLRREIKLVEEETRGQCSGDPCSMD
uniref:Uncharacterized protein n=1 Tax=Rhipicephalus zambeziensis TaxID=60191 RepID=A0A224YQQ0_9ACAR